MQLRDSGFCFPLWIYIVPEVCTVRFRFFSYLIFSALPFFVYNCFYFVPSFAIISIIFLFPSKYFFNSLCFFFLIHNTDPVFPFFSTPLFFGMCLSIAILSFIIKVSTNCVAVIFSITPSQTILYSFLRFF